MRIIKLNAIDSTNSFLRQLSVEEGITDYTVVVVDKWGPNGIRKTPKTLCLVCLRMFRQYI